jgi:hypothetical protein
MFSDLYKSTALPASQILAGNAYPRVTFGAMFTTLFFIATFAFASDQGGQKQAHVKDISSIEGIRDNQLVGYGIVVGLQGTGDSQQTAFPIQTLAATLLRMGVSVPASSIRVQNLAAPARNSISPCPRRVMREALKAACY